MKNGKNNLKEHMESETKWKENDGLKLKVVVTIDGTKEYLKNCVKLVDNYYVKGVQAIQIDKKWYPANSSVLFYDHEKRIHAIKKKGLNILSGIVGVKEDGSFIHGEFSPNNYNNCFVWWVKNNSKIKERCIDYKLVKSIGYIEHINDNVWAAESFFGENTFSPEELAILPARTRGILSGMYACSKESFSTPKSYKFENNTYNSENARNYVDVIEAYDNFPIDLTKDVKRAAKLIGDLTFGIEVECINGTLPDTLMNQLGIIICKDGSIGYAPEFVTVPLRGAKGLQTSQNLFMELNKRCTTDHSCSLHFHIGSVRSDREFIVALYKIYCDLQKDLHKMLPYYKTDPRGVKREDKNYCQFSDKALVMRVLNTSYPYKEKVNMASNAIQTFLLEGTSPSRDFNRKNMRHPNGGSKWLWHSRYFSQNLLNMFTSNRKTVEYRPHHSVLSHTKAINWLFICIAIVRYTEVNSSRIILDRGVYKLSDVIDYYKTTFKTQFAENVSNYLNAYVKSRQEFFGMKTAEGDKVVASDYQEKEYTFEAAGISGIF